MYTSAKEKQAGTLISEANVLVGKTIHTDFLLFQVGFLRNTGHKCQWKTGSGDKQRDQAQDAGVEEQ